MSSSCLRNICRRPCFTLGLLCLVTLLVGTLQPALLGPRAPAVLVPYLGALREPEILWNRREPAPSGPSPALTPYQERVRNELEATLKRYAPRLWWHPDERFGPMDPLEYFKRSTLQPLPGPRNGRRTASLQNALYLRYEGAPPDFPRNAAAILERAPLFWRVGSPSGLLGQAPPGKYRVLIEYWYYSPYNDTKPLGLGNHEGDWEGMAMLVEFGHDSSRLTHELKAAYYAAHEGGSWHCASELGWTEAHTPGGARPLAFSALGTHATYPREGRYRSTVLIDRAARGIPWDSWNRLLPLELEP
ncbi:MAG: Vps62-related protein, partial [Oligoflexia bacterium]|nr:Vps62-related protein [Oligoflexia bacterium]